VAAPVVVAPANELALRPVPAVEAPALVHVTVPAGAEVWFESDKTAQTGPHRSFQSPPLAPGKSYSYTVRARWPEGTGTREQIQMVEVRAGQTASVQFPRSAP
jgi:uncharacterized protein (TIGR03000 family)